MKRMLSFLLALVIITSVLPFSVFADDGVEPCAAASPCSECGSTNTSLVTQTTKSDDYQTSYCRLGNPPAVHTHRDYTTCTTFICHNCGDSYPKSQGTRTLCVSHGAYIN